eukprot:Rhum_TRINITY_DN11894_c0_g1::Rhum_TRINITY_DN11894_c0_g1_i1::g.47688::m.47688
MGRIATVIAALLTAAAGAGAGGGDADTDYCLTVLGTGGLAMWTRGSVDGGTGFCGSGRLLASGVEHRLRAACAAQASTAGGACAGVGGATCVGAATAAAETLLCGDTHVFSSLKTAAETPLAGCARAAVAAALRGQPAAAVLAPLVLAAPRTPPQPRPADAAWCAGRLFHPQPTYAWRARVSLVVANVTNASVEATPMLADVRTPTRQPTLTPTPPPPSTPTPAQRGLAEALGKGYFHPITSAAEVAAYFPEQQHDGPAGSGGYLRRTYRVALRRELASVFAVVECAHAACERSGAGSEDAAMEAALAHLRAVLLAREGRVRPPGAGAAATAARTLFLAALARGGGVALRRPAVPRAHPAHRRGYAYVSLLRSTACVREKLHSLELAAYEAGRNSSGSANTSTADPDYTFPLQYGVLFRVQGDGRSATPPPTLLPPPPPSPTTPPPPTSSPRGLYPLGEEEEEEEPAASAAASLLVVKAGLALDCTGEHDVALARELRLPTMLVDDGEAAAFFEAAARASEAPASLVVRPSIRLVQVTSDVWWAGLTAVVLVVAMVHASFLVCWFGCYGKHAADADLRDDQGNVVHRECVRAFYRRMYWELLGWAVLGLLGLWLLYARLHRGSCGDSGADRLLKASMLATGVLLVVPFLLAPLASTCAVFRAPCHVAAYAAQRAPVTVALLFPRAGRVFAAGMLAVFALLNVAVYSHWAADTAAQDCAGLRRHSFVFLVTCYAAAVLCGLRALCRGLFEAFQRTMKPCCGCKRRRRAVQDNEVPA